MLILIIIYLLSIIGCWWTYRRMSSRYLDKWLDEDCRIKLIWFVPLANTIMTIMVLVIIVNDKKSFSLPKSKWFNTDL